MKQFWRIGKLAAIILMGTGLLFAGCMGSDSSSSSEDDVIVPGGGAPSFLFEVDPLNASVDITPLTLSAATATIGGHPVEMVVNGSCNWDSGASELTCDIRLINNDPDEIMGIARTDSGSCTGPDCGTATVHNGDGSDPDYGGPLINTGNPGFCYAEIGGDENLVAANPEGCSAYEMGSGTGCMHAVSFLAAGGGYQDETWIFANAVNKYKFYTVLTGSVWYPENSAGSGDPRFDYTNYSTYALEFYDDDNINPGQCMVGAKLGGWQQGTPWCSTKTDVDNVPAGSDIWLNMFVEYADRIEQQHFNAWSAYDGNPDGGASSEDYEYYNVVQIEVVFDPLVLQHEGTGASIIDDSCIDIGAKYPCNYIPQAWQRTVAFDQYAQYSIDNTDNRIATAQNRPSGTFAFSPYYIYSMNMALCFTGYAGWPWYAGQDGMTSWNYTACTMNAQPVDSDLDLWAGHAKFTVIGAAGDYSPVKIGQGPNTNLNLYHSNGTAAGGPGGSSDDIKGSWCYSDIAGDTWWDAEACNTNPRNACNSGVTGENHIISGSLERQNCYLPPAWSLSRHDCQQGVHYTTECRTAAPFGDGCCGGLQSSNTHVAVH